MKLLRIAALAVVLVLPLIALTQAAINPKSEIISHVTVPGQSVNQGDWDWWIVRPTHKNYNMRVVATTLDDNIDLMVRKGAGPTLSTPDTFSSVRESNPWALDIGPEDLEQGDWYVGVRGDNKEPQQVGSSEYTLRAVLDFNFLSFNCSTCPNADCNDCNLDVVGSAEFVDDEFVRLTDAVEQQVGALWYTDSVNLLDGFETQFEFQISEFSTDDGGTSNSEYIGGANGFAFVIHSQKDGSLLDEAALGAGGYAMGYACNNTGCGNGITNSLAVEFDTWYDPELYDIKTGIVSQWVNAKQVVNYNDNHVAIMSKGALSNNASHVTQLGGTPSIPKLADGQKHLVRIKYFEPYLSVFIDDVRRPVLVVDHTMQAGVELSDSPGEVGKAIIGFTASTGSEYERHDILSWKFCGKIGCVP